MQPGTQQLWDQLEKQARANSPGDHAGDNGVQVHIPDNISESKGFHMQNKFN